MNYYIFQIYIVLSEADLNSKHIKYLIMIGYLTII